MTSPGQQETGPLSHGPPPESSITDSASATNAAIDHVEDDSAIAASILQGLAQGHTPSRETDPAAEPVQGNDGQNPIPSGDEDSQIRRLRMLSSVLKMFCEMLNLNASDGRSTVQVETLELLSNIMEGAFQCSANLQANNRQTQERINLLQMENQRLHENIKQLREEKKELNGKYIRLEHIAIRVEADNRTLRMEKEVLQGETVATDHGSMTEADEEGPSKKRSRRGT